LNELHIGTSTLSIFTALAAFALNLQAANTQLQQDSQPRVHRFAGTSAHDTSIALLRRARSPIDIIEVLP
jgi:hypothetical protein